MEQPYFQKVCVAGPLPVCDDVSARMISLPLFDTMTHHEVDQVVECLHTLIDVTEQAEKAAKAVAQRAARATGLRRHEPRDSELP